MMPHTQIRQVPAGPLVLGHSTRAFRTAALALFIRAGSCDERPPLLGVSHLLEHLVFKGSQRYTAEEILLFVEGQGGSINAFTTEEFTCFHLQVFPEHFERALDILIDMTARPLLRCEDIEKERRIALDEAKSCNDQPLCLLADLFSKSLWGNDPLGNCVGGTTESLRAMQSEQIAEFHAAHYQASKVVIAFAGDLDFESVVHQIQKQGRHWPTPPLTSVPKRSRKWSPGRDRFKSKALDQVHFQMGMRLWPKSDRHRAALSLLNALVGENMASRLFQDIREARGLAYHIASECAHFTAASTFSIQCIASEEKVGHCLEAISENLLGLQADFPTKGELERARCYLSGQTFQELDSPMGAVLWLGEQLFSGFMESPLTGDRYAMLLQSINAAEIQRCAAALIENPTWRIALVGPGRAKSATLKSWHHIQKFQTLRADQNGSQAIGFS